MHTATRARLALGRRTSPGPPSPTSFDSIPLDSIRFHSILMPPFILHWQGDPKSDAGGALADAVCEELGLRIGVSKIFLRKGAFEQLEARPRDDMAHKDLGS